MQNRQPQTTSTKLLTDLMKFYTDDAKKYGGEVYNILNTKLQVFYNYCITVKVLEE